ncbi:hypothetical protein ACF0H5_006077 [Mactra antiquata]
MAKLKLPESLSHQKGIPMSSFTSHVQNNKRIKIDKLSSWSFWNYLILVVCCLLVWFIVSLCCIKNKEIKSRLRKLAKCYNDKTADDEVTPTPSTNKAQTPRRETDTDQQ